VLVSALKADSTHYGVVVVWIGRGMRLLITICTDRDVFYGAYRSARNFSMK